MSSGITTKQDVRRADSLVSKESEKGWSLGRRRDDEVNREVDLSEECTARADAMLVESFVCACSVLGRDPLLDGCWVEGDVDGDASFPFDACNAFCICAYN